MDIRHTRELCRSHTCPRTGHDRAVDSKVGFSISQGIFRPTNKNHQFNLLLLKIHDVVHHLAGNVIATGLIVRSSVVSECFV